jgi:recombination protein RecA
MDIVKPESQSAEELFQFVLDAIETGEIGLCIFDSLGMLVSQQAYDKDIAERTYGGISMPLTTFSKKAEQLCYKTNCTIICINQIRDNLASMYGGTITCGGRAWRHACSLRLEFKRGDFFDEKGNRVNQTAENPAGNQIQLAVIKSKVFANNRKTGTMALNYLTGIDYVSDMIDVAQKLNYIVQSGAWYSIIDPETGEQIDKICGKPALSERLKSDIELYNKIAEAVDKYITEGQ